MRKVVVTLILLIIIGCSYFSPNYSKPKVAVPNQWTTSLANTETINESLPYLAWWQKFNDPELNYYIESGLKNNLSVEIAKANLEAAHAQLLAVKLSWLPFVSLFGGTINGSSQNSLAPIGNLAAISNSGGFFAILPAYTLNLFTNYTAQKQATYNTEVAKNAALSIRLAVIGQVVSAYFTNLAQQQLISQYTNLDNELLELITITQAMEVHGLTNQISVNDLKRKQQLLHGQLEIAQKNLTSTQNALRFLINQAPGNIVNHNKFAKVNAYQLIPGEMPVNVIASRPDILKAEAQLKAANEGISVSSSALLPSVNLNYFYATTSGSQSTATPVPGVSTSSTQNYYATYANWTISPSVFGQINNSTAQFKASVANYKLTVNNALHEVDNALASYDGYNKKMASNLNAYANLESSIEIQNSMYDKGLTTYALVLTSKMERDVLAIDITQTKLQQLISLVNLYQSLGGGYNYAVTPVKK